MHYLKASSFLAMHVLYVVWPFLAALSVRTQTRLDVDASVLIAP
jgi:hypothetical protein